jgi:LacI family transcriptional regulator
MGVTIYDVAGAAGVSLATVSRVLNSPEKVKEVTRNKVLRIIEELGYRPNLIARGLATKKTTTVGVVISDVTRSSTSQMLSGISDIAQKYGYTIKLFTIFEDVSMEKILDSVVSEHVDGILYLQDELTDHETLKVKRFFVQNHIPYVFANVTSSDVSVPTISIDYVKAATELTDKLIAKGCKDIYLISTVKQNVINDRREEGYTNAMLAANLVPRIIKTDSAVSVNQLHFAEFFKDKKIDAAIAVRDSLAVSFMNVAIEAGVKVPEELKVAGFQNTRFAELARPQLTSIDIPVYDIGAVAMRLLTKLMKHQKTDNTKVILPHRLIERAST